MYAHIHPSTARFTLQPAPSSVAAVDRALCSMAVSSYRQSLYRRSLYMKEMFCFSAESSVRFGACWRRSVAVPERRLRVGNGRSRPEERGSVNRTRAVGGVKSVSRFERQGKIRKASIGSQTGVNPGGEPPTERLARGVEAKNPSASLHKTPSSTVITLTTSASSLSIPSTTRLTAENM